MPSLFCYVHVHWSFDFWHFHMLSTVIFGIFVKFSGIYYANTPANGSSGPTPTDVEKYF